MSDNGLLIYLASSKTDQFGAGQSIQISNQPVVDVCPVVAMKQYLAVRPNFEGPLFCHFDGAPLSKYQFSAVLKKAIGVLGLNPHRYKSHSFRIGMATTLSMEGYSDDQIQIMGRWRSRAYLNYLRIPILGN